MEVVGPIRDKKHISTFRKVLTGDKDVNKRNVTMFTLGINTALRISDILLMLVSDVLDEHRKIKPGYKLREKKTGKFKSIPFSKKVQAALDAYLDGYDGDLSRPLFVSQKRNPDGTARPISRQQAYHIFREAARSIGIQESIGTHSLRKTLGYQAYKEGRSIELLQKLFNHSSPAVTLRYIGITQDEVDDVYISLDL